MDAFIWQPGIGLDEKALARLRTEFTRPREPMGEAWFMDDERQMFPELMGDLASLSTGDLQQPFQEIAGGTGSFGRYDEWVVWYHYLLAQLLPRGHERYISSLLESFITGFIAMYPNGIRQAPYPQFQSDILLTLGRCMMQPSAWKGNQLALEHMVDFSDGAPGQGWCRWHASGDFSASMFFCLKYLPPLDIPAWLQSVFDIPSPHWRAQVMLWLVGAHGMLTGQVQWPSEFVIEARPSVDWEWSHCLRPELAKDAPGDASLPPPLLTEVARSQALQAIWSYFTEEVFLDWLSGYAGVDYLTAGLAETPATFEELYLRRAR